MRRHRETGVFCALALLCLLWALLAKERFLNGDNFRSVAERMSFIGIMAVGQTLVILTGGIDLSVSALLAFTGCLSGMLVKEGLLPSVVAPFLGILVGLLAGLVTGGLVVGGRVPPFVASLGMMSVARGSAYVLTEGSMISDFPSAFLALGRAQIGPFSLPTALLLFWVLLGSLLLLCTPFGRYLYAIGGSEESARLSGVPVNRIKLTVYALSGLLAGLTGVLFASYYGVAQGDAGLGMELDVIASVVIGGVSLSGGQGSIIGALLGVALLVILRNGMVLWNVPAFWQEVFIGGVIWTAALMDSLRQREKGGSLWKG